MFTALARAQGAAVDGLRSLPGGGAGGRPVAGVRAARVVEAVLRTSTAQRPAVVAVLDALRAEAASLIRTRA